jgi:hypothetical protein
MKQNLSYKNIHIGAIATFYIIALLVRLISLYVVDKYPSIETNSALRVSAALATGLGPAIGALVAIFHRGFCLRNRFLDSYVVFCWYFPQTAR